MRSDQSVLLRRAVFVLVVIGTLTPGRFARAQPARTMRVRLLADQAPERISVQAHGGAVDVFSGDAAGRLLRLKDGATMTISRRSQELHLAGKKADLFALDLQFAPAGKADIVLSGKAFPDEPTPYPGTLTVKPDPTDRDALRLLNRVNLETYVASVLGSEYGLKDEEGTKAMAVAARTYALHSSNRNGDDAYDLGDQVWSQRYEGARGISEATLRAAHATRGEVITYDNALIKAYYFSSSGGHTANNEDVWKGKAVPYLRGKPDPYDAAASPHIPWTERLSRRKLLRALSRSFAGRITGFVIGSHSTGGRVKTIELLRRNRDRLLIRGSRFRRVVNEHFGYMTLLSTLFDARRDGSRYVFEGKGFGHGVGLSQWGAHEMAEREHSYKDILRFYYTGVSIGAMSETDSAPVAQAELEAGRPKPAPPEAESEPASETPAETSLAPSQQEAEAPPPETPPETTSQETPTSTASTSSRAPADTLSRPFRPQKGRADEKETTGRIGW